MRLALVFLLAWHAAVAYGADNPYADEDWLREGFAPQIQKFKRVTIQPCPDDKSVVAAYCETQFDWWGRLRIFHQTSSKIDWIARFPRSYSENCGHYILSADWCYLEKLDMWVMQVFDSTHMGNGSLWLFTLKGHHLRLLLHTRAVGKYWGPGGDGAPDGNLPIPIPEGDEAWFVGDHLQVEYRALKDDAYESVLLTGTIAVGDRYDHKTLATKPYAETWMWDSNERIFIHAKP